MPTSTQIENDPQDSSREVRIGLLQDRPARDRQRRDGRAPDRRLDHAQAAGRVAPGPDPRRPDRGDGRGARPRTSPASVRLQPADRDAGQRAGRRRQGRRRPSCSTATTSTSSSRRRARSSGSSRGSPGRRTSSADLGPAADAPGLGPTATSSPATGSTRPTCSTWSPRSAARPSARSSRARRRSPDPGPPPRGVAERRRDDPADPDRRPAGPADPAGRPGRRHASRTAPSEVERENRPAPGGGRRQRPRPRPRRLRRRGPGARSHAKVELPPGYILRWGGTVRAPPDGHAAAHDRRADRPGPDLPAAVQHVRLGPAGGPDLPGRADGGDRRRLRPGRARAAVLDLGGRRLHRPVRRGGAQRPGLGQRRRAPASGRGRARTRRPARPRWSGSGRS